ncbi:hypothetical protein F5Y11DRAFT_326336 [Daldinia sp. FL1419]|nr:hypothetical protein F5Y11DRAFT_326336 [Daldinia sp. FL1419]
MPVIRYSSRRCSTLIVSLSLSLDTQRLACALLVYYDMHVTFNMARHTTSPRIDWGHLLPSRIRDTTSTISSSQSVGYLVFF